MSVNSGDTTIVRTEGFIAGGRSLEGGRGWAWIASGWELFKRSPGLWIAMILVYGVICFGLGLVPIIGALATVVLTPVLGAGLVITAAKCDRGETPEFGDLFAGFQSHFGKLATVGAIYLGGFIVIFLAAGVASGVGIAALAQGGEGAAKAGGAVLLAVLIALALMVPLLMAVWFAAPLVLFQEQGAVAAMQGSFSGCMKNVVPFLLYGVIGFAFAMLATIPLMLGWLVLGPVLAASVYTGYKDIFVG
jgi:uncharacterized membrane protein